MSDKLVHPYTFILDLCFSIVRSAAAEGIEAYTMGLTSSMQYFAYSAAMEGAKEATDGDHVKIPGGMSSITFDKTFGEALLSKVAHAPVLMSWTCIRSFMKCYHCRHYLAPLRFLHSTFA